MAVKVHKPITLYRSKQFFSAFPSIVTASDGDILLAFRRAPDHRWLLGDIADEDFNSVDHVHFRSHIAFMRFDQDVQCVSDAKILPVHAEAGDQDGNLFLSKTGRLFQYSFRWYPVTAEICKKLKEAGRSIFTNEHLGAGYIYHSSYIRYSDDEGASWSAPIEAPKDTLVKPGVWPEISATAALKGRMIDLPDGSLLLASYFGGVDGHKYETVRLFKSADNGLSWAVQDRVCIAREEGSLQEPTLASWPEGKISVFCRTTNNDDKLVIAQSSDDGETFGTPETIDITGHPYDALVLPDGRLFLVYGYRHKPMGVRARLVKADGSLADADEIIIRDDSPCRDAGYPSASLLGDGRILVAYYIADNNGIRGIEASIVEFD